MNEIEAMYHANEISQFGLGSTFPNPIVGAVILSPEGELITEGFHRRGVNGQPGDHAEVVAMKNAGEKARGATLVVTLEPCNHHGKTPPCTEAIIKAGISKVIYGIDDPNGIAQGGADRLRKAGIKVESGVLREEIAFANRAWIKKVSTGYPYFTIKIAATVDGFIAAKDGASKWITSSAARADVARLRSQSDAIVTGTGTVLADDPKLTARGVEVTSTPERIIMGTREIPHDFQIWDKSAPTHQIKSRDLSALREYCHQRRFNSVLIEAGPLLTSSFIAHGLVDEVIIYQAPTLLGEGRSMASNLGISTLTNRLDFTLSESQIIGEGDERNLRIRLNSKSTASTSREGI